MNVFLRVFTEIIRKILGHEYSNMLKYDKIYKFERLYYIGLWAAMYSSSIPKIDKFLYEECSYQYFDPIHMAKKLGLKEKSGRSVQIKYFYYGLCENTNTWHTVIYECNVYDDFTVEWNYGQKLNFEIVKYKKKLRLIPYMRKGKSIRNLSISLGWNRHCRYYLGFDQSATQYFVLEEKDY